MDAKLTLKLNKAVIDRAKEYAQDQNTSLSRLVEDYLDLVVSSPETKIEITPLVRKLSGVARVSNNYNSRKEYRKFLVKKYK